MCHAYDEECFRITTEKVEEVSNLGYNQEEGDTGIYLHAKNVITWRNTDVFRIAIARQTSLVFPFVWKGVLKTELGLFPIFLLILEVIFPKTFLEYTGYDSISTLARKRKLAALKLSCKYLKFQRTFCCTEEEIEVKCRSYERIFNLNLFLNISAFIFLVRVIKKDDTEVERIIILHCKCQYIEHVFFC